FHLEDDGLAVTDIDHAGVLARALNDSRPGRGQGAQPFLGRLVRTVLVPHRRKDAEFGETRLAPDQRENALVFVRLETVRGNQFGRDGNCVRYGHFTVSHSEREEGDRLQRLWPRRRQTAPASSAKPARPAPRSLLSGPGTDTDR